MFHQAHVFAEEQTIHRKDVNDLHPITTETADFYTGKLGRNTDLEAVFELTGLDGKVLEYTKFGTMITKFDMPGIVALAGLFVMGQVPKVDQKFCRLFQERCGKFSDKWKLPMPPMEFEPRPLFFYVVFNLDGGDLWKTACSELILRANGLGLALMRQQGIFNANSSGR